jgi:hypothetical protein
LKYFAKETSSENDGNWMPLHWGGAAGQQVHSG